MFAQFGIDLSETALVFSARTVVAAYAVGMLVTLFAAYLPARRAAKIAPVAAMRDDIAMPESSVRRRMIFGGVLALIERTREVGLLRAVGLSRRQLRRMVRLESIAIAVLGAALGVAMGLVFGVALQRAVADQGVTDLAVPVVRLVLFVRVAVVVGVLAVVVPARRAAKLNVLRAITTE